MLDSYINRGSSEIHWEGSKDKKKHFELLNLLKEEYPSEILKIIERVRSKYSSKDIERIVNNVDMNLPEVLSDHKLSENRKELMIKLITLRLERLFELE